MTPFDKAAQEKFNKGAQEHRQPWDNKHIDARSEIMDELLDTYHYSGLLKEKSDVTLKEYGRALHKLSRGYWEQLNDTIPPPSS